MRSVCMVRMSTLASFSCLKMRRVASIPFSSGSGGSVVARAPARGDEAELPELRPQRFARHAQAARRRGTVVAVLAEPRADGRELDLAHDLLERTRAAARRRGRALDDPRGEEVGRDALARLRAQDEPVDLVLQLAHVAGPRVALEEPERARVEG